jgi:predicted glutamine amidotransferase
MCRLSAFPPGFKRLDAIDILLDFEKQNTDGTGFVFIRDGKFIVNKWVRSLSYLLKRGYPVLTNMPHNGWTLAHLRAASHGGNCKENTHPFIIDNKWAVIHNGIFNEYNIAKLGLGKHIKLEGETDSEVAAHLINISGPKKFAAEIDMSGVFLALNASGGLWAIKTSGDLEFIKLKNDKIVMASTFPIGTEDTIESLPGWYYFNSNGELVKHKKKEWEWSGGITIPSNHIYSYEESNKIKDSQIKDGRSIYRYNYVNNYD